MLIYPSRSLVRCRVSSQYWPPFKFRRAIVSGTAEMRACLEEHRQPWVKSVTEQTGCSMVQVALAWLRYRAVPVIPIIGARKQSQLQDNLASLDLELCAEQLKSLDAASRIELEFPQSL